MASVIGICNSALVKIGARTITSLTEGSKNANLCNEQFAKLRDEVLRAHSWNFAVARAKLGRLVEAPAFGFAYAYQLPSDFLRAVAIHDNPGGGTVPYQIEGQRVLTDAEAIYLRYVRRIEDPNAFDALFREALAYRVAAELAVPIAQSSTLHEQMQRLSDRAVRRARGVDAQENYPEPLPDGSWLTARG